MVAYSFKAVFVPAISAGLKTQTIRADRRRHARPGETIQLYQGMRTKHCRKIRPDVTCTAIVPVTIQVSTLIDTLITGIAIDGVFLRPDEIEAFAAADGFAPEYFNALAFGGAKTARENMGRFWLGNRGEGWFDDVLITWEPGLNVVHGGFTERLKRASIAFEAGGYTSELPSGPGGIVHPGKVL